MSKKMPNSVCWNITSRCNEKCKFCYRDRDSREVSFADKKKVIDRIAAAGIRKLTFAGGEPLLVENIRELILYAKSRGLMVSLTTNSILLKGEILDFCLQELDWLTMSLDGDSNATQSRMTRHGKHFDRVMEVLAYAAVYPERNCRIKLKTWYQLYWRKVLNDGSCSSLSLSEVRQEKMAEILKSRMKAFLLLPKR